MDHSTPFAHSAPVQVEVEGVGVVEVEGLRAKPTHSLDPPQVRFTANGAVLSHLTFHKREPQRIRVAIELMAQGLLSRAGIPHRGKLAGMELLAALAKANQQLLAELAEAALPFAGCWPSAALLIDAAESQKELIEQIGRSGSS